MRMMMKKILALAAIFFLALAGAAMAQGRGGGGHGGGGHGGGGGGHFGGGHFGGGRGGYGGGGRGGYGYGGGFGGFGFGYPGLDFYGDPYSDSYYGYGDYADSYGGYAAPPPPGYPDPGQYATGGPPEASGPASGQYWYHCDSPQGYYPYVRTCSRGWQQVPATPPDGER
jgi:hypothetical protein